MRLQEELYFTNETYYLCKKICVLQLKNILLQEQLCFTKEHQYLCTKHMFY